MTTEYGARLRAARKHADLTQEELSKKTGIPQSTISTAERLGHGSAETPVYAKACGVDAHWLATGQGKMLPQERILKAQMRRARMLPENSELNEGPLVEYAGPARSHRVEVVGMARLGENGFYEEVGSLAGTADGTVEAYSDDPGAYALRVRGDSMFPAIRDGWYIVVEPHSPVSTGEYVLIKLLAGQSLIMELIMDKPESITVVSVNGDARRTILREELDSRYGLQPIVAILSPSKWRPA